MGKYDFLLKFLGKEHQFTPEQINDDLRNVERAPVEDNEEEESVPTNSSFDLDSFINPSGGGSSSLDDLDEIRLKLQPNRKYRRKQCRSDVLEELENLDGPPPDKADIERRSQTQGGGDLIQDMLNEQAAEQPVPVEDEPEEMPNPDLDFSPSIPDMPDDIIPSSASDEGIDDELGGFVSQFSADDGQSATPADEDIFGGMDTTLSNRIYRTRWTT